MRVSLLAGWHFNLCWTCLATCLRCRDSLLLGRLVQIAAPGRALPPRAQVLKGTSESIRC